jgi:hypothetical protein
MTFTSSELRILGSLCRKGGTTNFSKLKQSLGRMDKEEMRKAFEKLKHDKVVAIRKDFGIGRPAVNIHLLDESVKQLFK